MQTLELTSEELDTLRQVLATKVKEMDVETFRTDSHDFKVMLKHQRELLDHLLAKLNSLPAAA